MGFAVAIIDSDLFFPTAFDILAVLPCTFTYCRKKTINHKTLLTTIWSISWDQFSSTSLVRSAISHLGTWKNLYIYFLCYLSKHQFEYPSEYLHTIKLLCFMLRIISRMILCKEPTDILWVIFLSCETVPWIT